VLAAVGALVLTISAAPAQRPVTVETFSEPVVSGIDLEGYVASHEKLRAELLAEMPDGALDRVLDASVTPDDLQRLKQADADDPGRTVVGMARRVGRMVDLSNPAAAADGLVGGAVRRTDDGGFVWAVTVVSEGASALRIHLTDLRLPAGTELFVYSPNTQAFGPYRGSDGGDLWTNTVFGSRAVLQVRRSGPVATKAAAGFRIAEVGYIGAKFLPAAHVSGLESFCSYNASCIENTNCGGPSWSAKSDAENAAAMMLWIQGPYIYTCTGGLLNDTDPATQIPYFLTANHCISSGNVTGGLETYFQYQVTCGSSCPPAWTGGGIMRSGASLLATNSTGDFTLLELSQTPPSGSVLMGWTTANVANANGTALFRISHPATAPQAYSTQTVDTSAPTCSSWPRGERIYSRDTYGATEGGSSGSPVYNSAGQVVGQLSGACGYNPNDACDSVSNATVDGAFASYYSQIAGYLDPTPCVPVAEVCDDGVDNDCDAAIDCDDADCAGDPACAGGQCLDPGASCSSNADCCSNKCRGRRNNKTCR